MNVTYTEVNGIRDLSIEEIALVNGGKFSLSGLGSSMVAGGVTGGMAAAATGIGIPAGIAGGALLGGMAYTIVES